MVFSHGRMRVGLEIHAGLAAGKARLSQKNPHQVEVGI
jgi:hypothetical protein